MGNLIVVGISDQQIAAPPDTLITYALGSCVGICLCDSLRQFGGLSHVLLPEAFNANSGKDIFKFADTAIAELVRRLERRGCARSRLTAKIAGGANMFATTGASIGERNVETVKRELHKLRIRLVGEDVGLNYGRTVEFNPKDGSMTVKSIGKPSKVL